MRVTILNDWRDTLWTLPSFSRLDGHDFATRIEPGALEAALLADRAGFAAVDVFDIDQCHAEATRCRG